MSLLMLGLLHALTGQQADDEAAVVPPYRIVAETAVEHFDAAVRMIRVGREDVAVDQLRQMFEARPSDEDLVTIRDDYGTGLLLSLARNEQLQPLGKQVLDEVAAAVERTDRDPAATDRRIAALAAGGDPALAAARELRRIGEPAAVDLINRSVQSDADQLRGIVRGLRAIGPAAAEPLIAAADSGDATVLDVVAASLGAAASPDAVLGLISLEADPNRPAAIRTAASQALDRLSVAQQRVDPTRALKAAARRLLAGDETPKVDVIEWSPRTGQLRRTPQSLENRRGRLAQRYLVAAAAADPSDRDAVSLARLFEGEPPPEEALALLQISIDLNLERLGLEAIQRIADRDAALASGSPLLAALTHPSREMQLAAAAKIAELEPREPLSGGSQVVSILLANLRSTGRPVVVVVDPNSVRGSVTAGRFASLGFDQRLTRTGSDGVAMAADIADTELIVIDPAVIRPPLSTTLASLAASPRTQEIPVVVLTFGESLRTASAALRNHPNAVMVGDAADFSFVADQIGGLLPSAEASRRRQPNAQLAAAALAAIAGAESSPLSLVAFEEEIVRILQENARLTPVEKAAILQHLGSSAAARALAALLPRADENTRPLIEAAIEAQRERYTPYQ